MSCPSIKVGALSLSRHITVLLIGEHGMFLHVFTPSVISFMMFCSFQTVSFQLLLLHLLLSILCVFDAVVNELVFLISFLNCL